MAPQPYTLTPCLTATAQQDSALTAMHVHTHATSQLKRPGPAFPPDSPMGVCDSNGLMRGDSQKCIAMQRGTAGQSAPETERAGKPTGGAACHGRYQELGCGGGDADKAVGRKSRGKTLTEYAKLRAMSRSLEQALSAQRGLVLPRASHPSLETAWPYLGAATSKDAGKDLLCS